MASLFYSLYASAMALPHLLLFYTTWICVSLFRPVVILTLVSLATKPKAAIHKFQIFVTTITFLLFCKDKKWKAPPTDPLSYFEGKPEDQIKKKTIIFVRHGESTWNDTFNKGDRKTLAFIQGFLPGLVKAFFMEWYFWVTGQEVESWFYDAPLSPKGLSQAEKIHDYLSNAQIDFMPPKEKELMKLLLNDSEESKSQLVSSNLRRAIATMAVGFRSRLEKSRSKKDVKDQILLLPELQEISFNPDALSITPAHTNPALAYSDPKLIKTIYGEQIDTKLHTGNKKLSENGLFRLKAFCKLVFDEEAIPSSTKAVICAGHSLWFRSFFKTYLPYSIEHIAKKKKLQNGAIAAFTLNRIKGEDGEFHYLIDAKSIVVMHGGF